MTIAHYAKLWTVVGLVLVFYSLNAWIASQGGQPFLDAKLLEERAPISGFVAIPICAVLLGLLAEIGIRHARRSGKSGWHDRMPVVGLDGLDTTSREGKLYQGFFLILFVAAPIAALIHFVRKSLSLSIFNAATRKPISLFELPSPFSATTWNDGYRIGEGVPSVGESLAGTITWLPLIEPLIFAALVLLALWRCWVLLAELFSSAHAPSRGRSR